MTTEIRTERVYRTSLDKLLLWRHANRTKIFDSHREATGRGPTAEASREAALRAGLAKSANRRLYPAPNQADAHDARTTESVIFSWSSSAPRDPLRGFSFNPFRIFGLLLAPR